MKRKISFLLTVVMTLTMILGMSITAFAQGEPTPPDSSYDKFYYVNDNLRGAYKVDDLFTGTSSDGLEVSFRLVRIVQYESPSYDELK